MVSGLVQRNRRAAQIVLQCAFSEVCTVVATASGFAMFIQVIDRMSFLDVRRDYVPSPRGPVRSGVCLGYGSTEQLESGTENQAQADVSSSMEAEAEAS